MKIIDWNICCMKSPETKIELLKSVIGNDSFVAILQEVTPYQYSAIKMHFTNTRYSLNYRAPSKFDRDNRRLGISIICSDDINIKSAGVLSRCLLPERTLMVDMECKGSMLRIIGLHSITGCSHLNAKSIQFLSWAEAVDEYKPDIVAFDANEPAKDHYDVEQMEFFTNKDNGYAAKTFFMTLKETGLTDVLLSDYDIKNYVPGEPLAVSHHIRRGNQNKRYDFVFTKENTSVSKCKYYYDEFIKAGSDHAMICVDLIEKRGNSNEDTMLSNKEVILLSGKEQFTDNGDSIGLTVNDFWSFQFSNILHDPDEIAEFLVAKALDQEKPFNKDHWTLYDIDYNGVRIEVKETAYYHPFNKDGELSQQRVFGITKANSDYEEPDKENRYERQNDIYVFCLLTGENKDEAWPLEVSHWEFYVVPTIMINKECGDQKTVSLSRVQSFTNAVDFKYLKDTIDNYAAVVIKNKKNE